MALGVIIGRFQLDELHDGHMQLLKWVQERHEQVMLLLGGRHSPANRDNPLSFQIREAMLRPYLPNAVILPVWDMPDDVAWSKQVDGLVSGIFPNREVTLYGGRESFIPHYHGHYKTRVLDFGSDEDSGTSVRKQIGESVENDPKFRRGIINALQNLHPRIYLTVDIAMIRGTDILMGRKPMDKLWRLPGGFVDLRDPTLEHAARRELHEETGMSVEGQLRYLGSFTIDDWRSRGAEDCKHMTALFVAQHAFGAPQASDDLEEVAWRSLADFYAMQKITESHRPLVQRVIDHCCSGRDMEGRITNLQLEIA